MDGYYDLTITTNKNNKKGKDFALYKSSSRKGRGNKGKGKRKKQVKVHLYVISTDEPTSIKIKVDKSAHLKSHSDNFATGNNCTNQVKFYLSIQPKDLKKAEAGVYDFAFCALPSSYSGKS